MARLHPPVVTEKLVPVFTSEELSKLQRACQGRSFAQRRDAAIIAVFTATGIRAAELAGICYDAHDPRASDVGLWQRRSPSGGRAARRGLSRSLMTRPAPWTGISGSGPVMPRRGGARCGWGEQPRAADGQRHLPDDCPPRPRMRGYGPSAPVPAPFSHTWLDLGGAEADLMELNGWSSPQMLRRYGASARSARARRTYDRIMTDT